MRKIWDIPGGIHPPENKKQSVDQSIGALPLPDRLVLPLNQHIGAPARPVVKPGDRVLKGQVVAEPHGIVSAGVHASTSGVVESISLHPVPHPSAMSSNCIIVRPDGEDRWIEHQGIADYGSRDPQQLLDIIRLSGIAGLGGAGFPASVKLGPRQPIDTLIINGTECEPYITADDMLMRERPGEIVAGIRILAHILGNPANILIGIEDNKPEAYDALEAALASNSSEGSDIELVDFPTKYPSGGEKQLIQILTGKEVPSGKLPAELGIVCHNVGTTQAIYRAIVLGEPLISRITTVTGQSCAINRNYDVLLGTPVRHLLANNGFDADSCPRLIMGGPMMGFTLENPEVPVIKTTNCILAPSREEMPPAPLPQPCIRCGMCAEACPASLLPQQLFWYAQSENFDRLEAHNLFDCIECGACAYVCPSNIPLVQYYRAAKGEIRTLKQEKIKADHSRQRFEFHKERLERAEAEKAAKREARRRATESARARGAEDDSGITASVATSTEASSTAATSPEAKAPEAGTSAAKATVEDIIMAAKARAEARKASPEQRRAALERGIEAARHRLDSTRQKLADGEADNLGEASLDKLRAAVEDARVKLADAEGKLAKLDLPDSNDSDPADSSRDTGSAERVAKKLGDSPRQQLQGKIAAINNRIAVTEQKLAELTDAATLDALRSGLDKQRQKLAEAQQQLSALPVDTAPAPVESPVQDAAAAAITRAREKAARLAQMSPEEKLRSNLDSLVSRLDKARARLATAIAENADHVETLRTTVVNLESKVREAETKLAQGDH